LTLVSEIIQRAYRANNLIPIGATVTANQSTEALAYLNSLLLSTVGNEASDGLTDIIIGTSYDETDITTQWVPDNARLILNLTAAKTFYLDPQPQDGQRFAIIDVDGNLNTYNVVINGNGRNIETASTVTLNTASLNRQWMYRADTGNWVRIAAVATSDEMPFPREFDDYFILMLAVRLDPQYGQTIPPETARMLSRARSQLHSRYALTKEILPDVDWQSVPSQRRFYTAFGSNNFEVGRTR
jgi:hypothetical protein